MPTLTYVFHETNARWILSFIMLLSGLKFRHTLHYALLQDYLGSSSDT